MKAGPIRLVATLAIAGFFSGVLLVGVYSLTQPLILRNQAEALEAAIFQVLPGTVSRQAFVWEGDQLVPLKAGESPRDPEDVVYAGYDRNGDFVGYAIPAQGAGFQDTIQLIYGYRPGERKIVGMRVLESRETPGLGDKIIKDQDFVGNFDSLAIDPQVTGVKPGTKSEPYQVDTISGATISSTAVIRIINQGNQRWASRLETAQPGKEKR